MNPVLIFNFIKIRDKQNDSLGISKLFDVDRSVVTKHLKSIFESGELDENSTCAFFAQVADNEKKYNYASYQSDFDRLISETQSEK